MFRGFYTAASGMISQQRRQEMITNNVANVNTPGYKADQVAIRSFPELLIREMNGKNIPTYYRNLHPQSNRPIGTLNTGVYAQELMPNFMQGLIRETMMDTDFAIVHGDLPDETGAIFFTVQNDNGDLRYTRNGNFTVDGEGYLTSNEGFYVLDASGNRIQTDGQPFRVTEEAHMEFENTTIPLGLAYIADANQLVKEGNDLFNAEQGDAVVTTPANAEAAYIVRQGFLEGSNVDPMQSMTDMIQAYRNFELNQRVLRTYDENMAKAVNDIARLG